MQSAYVWFGPKSIYAFPSFILLPLINADNEDVPLAQMQANNTDVPVAKQTPTTVNSHLGINLSNSVQQQYTSTTQSNTQQHQQYDSLPTGAILYPMNPPDARRASSAGKLTNIIIIMSQPAYLQINSIGLCTHS